MPDFWGFDGVGIEYILKSQSRTQTYIVERKPTTLTLLIYNSEH